MQFHISMTEGSAWDDDDLTCKVVSGLSIAVILLITGIVIGLFIGIGVYICKGRKKFSS